MLPGEYLLAALPAYEFFTLMRDPARLEGLAAIGARVSLEDPATGVASSTRGAIHYRVCASS
jgi:hypothetical protein